MRWQTQELRSSTEGALPGMARLAGLVRSVTTPEFAGITFHEVLAKSALNKVPEASGLPFRWTINPYRGCSHACAYCLAGDTLILMGDGRVKPLADVRIGDQVYGTRRTGRRLRLVRTEVLHHWRTVKPAYQVDLEGGGQLVASGDHRFLTEHGWRYVAGPPSLVSKDDAPAHGVLEVGDELLAVGSAVSPPDESTEYRLGYLAGMVRGVQLAAAEPEAHARARRYLAHFGMATAGSGRAAIAVQVPAARASGSPGWRTGFLAGVFDAEGTSSRDGLRVGRLDADDAVRVVSGLDELGFVTTVETGRVDDRRTVHVVGGLRERLRFFHTVGPATRAMNLEDARVDAGVRVLAVTELGAEMPMYDLTTTTGDFVANGVISHNCFARGTHTYLDLDPGEGFDREIVVKTNVAEVLQAELARTSWSHEHVALGTNTDPYQRAEGRYQLMPGIVEALAASATPFSILTKGTLARRDLPLIQQAAESVDVGMAVSLAVLEPELQRSLEPGTPGPRARLELVRAIRAAGLPCSVLIAPVLPWLTDSEERLGELVADLAAAGATGVTTIALHLRPGAREWFMGWLGREHPELVERYRRLYGARSYVPSVYTSWLQSRVQPILRRHGLDRPSHHRQRRRGAQPEGSAAAPATLF